MTVAFRTEQRLDRLLGWRRKRKQAALIMQHVADSTLGRQPRGFFVDAYVAHDVRYWHLADIGSRPRSEQPELTAEQ